MAARDRYSSDLTCDDCGTVGRARFSENDYPFMSSIDFSVDGIEGPFVATKVGPNIMTTEICCRSCGKKVVL